MTRLLIVDDEAAIRKGLQETIEWERYGIRSVTTASNGAEALEALRREEADIVIADIRMPLMDGLELVAAMKSNGIGSKVVIISGYDDFEYARQAMRMGVQEYLLKPVDIDELLNVVLRIGSERKRERHEATLRWFVGRVAGAAEDIAAEPSAPRPPIDGPFRVACSSLSDYAEYVRSTDEERRSEVAQRWKRTADRSFSACSADVASVYIHPNVLVSILMDAFAEEGAAAAAADAANDWEGPSKLLIGVSDVCLSPDEAMDAYRQALDRLESLCAPGSGQGRGYSPPSSKQVELLFQQLMDPDPEAVRAASAQWFRNIESQRLRLPDAADACRHLVLLLDQRLAENGTYVWRPLHFRNRPDLYVYNSYAQLESLFLSDLLEIREHLERNRAGNKHYALMEKAKAYIEERFREELKASDVADLLHVSPNYFSQIFNQEMGKSFNEYVNYLRVEKAKELLRLSNDKVFQIAEEVGYKDYKHFAYVFKHMTGVTPTAYRGMYAAPSREG